MINLKALLDELDGLKSGVKLVAVSKNVTSSEVLELFKQGQLDYGENRVQEMAKKQSELISLNLNWHMIGRLQTNKINQLISLRPTLWQSCDSFDRAVEVDKRLNYRLDTLLQINSANEDTKQGVDIQSALDTYQAIREQCTNINLIGVMSIGANSDDTQKIQKSFEITHKIYESLAKYGAKICSMGMSGDYKLAIKCGSNMIRLGTMLYI